MSRAKIGHEFCPMPRKWHAGWAHHLTFHARGLRDALFELADGAPITIHGDDWLASLCNQLCVHGKDRPNVRRTLKAFGADGLIGFDGTHVHGRYLPDAEPIPTRSTSSTDRAPIERQRSTNESLSCQSLPLPLESTPRNDSGHISQTDRRDRKKDERDSARAVEVIPFRRPLPEQPPDAFIPKADPEPEPEVTLGEQIVRSYRKRHLEKLATSPSESRWHRKSADDIAEWCSRPENLKAYKCTPLQLAEYVLEGLFADRRAEEQGFKLSWAVNGPEQYARASKPKPRLEMHQPWREPAWMDVTKLKPPAAVEPIEPEGEVCWGLAE